MNSNEKMTESKTRKPSYTSEVRAKRPSPRPSAHPRQDRGRRMGRGRRTQRVLSPCIKRLVRAFGGPYAPLKRGVNESKLVFLNQLGGKILLFLIALTLPATVFAVEKP